MIESLFKILIFFHSGLFSFILIFLKSCLKTIFILITELQALSEILHLRKIPPPSSDPGQDAYKSEQYDVKFHTHYQYSFSERLRV